MAPKGSKQLRLFGRSIRAAVDKAIKLRAQLRSIPIRDIGDVDAMAALDGESRQTLLIPQLLANSVVGVFLTEALEKQRSARLQTIEALADAATSGTRPAIERLQRDSLSDLAHDVSESRANHPFHWPLEFPEVFQTAYEGFDAIIGNPPFGEGDLISDNFRRAIDASLGSSASNVVGRDKKTSKLNFVSMFIMLSQKIGGKHAHIGLVCPKTILRNERYWKVRSSFCAHSRLKEVVNFPPDAFRSASVETCAIILKNGRPLKESDEYFVSDLSGKPSEKICINASSVVVDPKHMIRVEASSDALELIAKMDAQVAVLSDFYETRDGINPGRKDFRPILLAKKVDNKVIPLCADDTSNRIDRAYTQSEMYDPNVHKRTLNGRDFEAFGSINWNGAFVRYKQKLAYIEEYFVKGTRWSAQLRQLENYDRPEKVISRQTANTLIATLDTDRYFPLNTVHSHFPKSEESPYSCKFLLGVLNSRLLRFYYQKKSEETGKVFPQVHISALRKLPLPINLSDQDSAEISKIVDSLLLDPLDEQALSHLNQKVYALYDLEERERLMVEEEFSGAAGTNSALSPRISQRLLAAELGEVGGADSAAVVIADLLLKKGSWLSKSDIIQMSGVEPNKWNAAIKDLLSRGIVERQGERRGARYRFTKDD